jgi:hypothetical protein
VCELTEPRPNRPELIRSMSRRARTSARRRPKASRRSRWSNRCCPIATLLPSIGRIGNKSSISLLMRGGIKISGNMLPKGPGKQRSLPSLQKRPVSSQLTPVHYRRQPIATLLHNREIGRSTLLYEFEGGSGCVRCGGIVGTSVPPTMSTGLQTTVDRCD